MTKLAISLLTGAAALVAGSSAQAAPLSPVAPALDSNIEHVRMVCNEYGRCWRERGPRIVFGDSYNAYGPRRGYGGYGGYGHEGRYYHRQPGVQFNAPGISFGIGGPRW